jgi:hypothetical protein
MSETKQKPSRKRYLLAAVLVILLIAALVFIWFTQNEPKPDKASERLIRKVVAAQLKKDPNELNDEDYALFKQISFTAYGGFLPMDDPSFLLIGATEVSDIKLLKKFTNLQTLDMYSINYPENKISKLMEILRKFGINTANRFVIDLTPLEGLSNLHTLSFNGTSIKNIEPLSNLINLRNLDISNTYVIDLKPIKELTNLQQLSIRNCPKIIDRQVEDLQKALPNLKIYR